MKTPEQMAVQYIKDVETARNPSVTATAFPQMQRCYIAGYKAGHEQALNTISKMDNATDRMLQRATCFPAAQQWISVKERLPKDGEEVLVFGQYLNDIPKVLGVRSRYKGDQEWKYTWEGSDEWVYTQDDVTHWMPLPDAPKEEK